MVWRFAEGEEGFSRVENSFSLGQGKSSSEDCSGDGGAGPLCKISFLRSRVCNSGGHLSSAKNCFGFSMEAAKAHSFWKFGALSSQL